MDRIPAYRAWNRIVKKEFLRGIFLSKIKAKPSVGLDWVTVDKFETEIDAHLDLILDKCSTGKYHFTRYREVLLSKGATKLPRSISIPTVRDKLVLTALSELLTDVYGKSALVPMPQVVISNIGNSLKLQELDSFVKADITAFYASIDHTILLDKLKKNIRKPQIHRLIKDAISTNAGPANVIKGAQYRQKGLPEGLPISNQLANIYMESLDSYYQHYCSKHNFLYCRYVDDILILTKQDYINQIKEDLHSRMEVLGLQANREKTLSGNVVDGFDFLGYSLSQDSITVRTSSVHNLERTIESIFRAHKQSFNPNIEYLEWKINLKITGFIFEEHKYGWIFFYSQITKIQQLKHLDWFVSNLCKRFDIHGIRFKKFIRTFHEITKSLHTTTYIPNLDKMSIDDKRRIVQDIYGENIKDSNDAFVMMRFKKIMRREMRNIQKDVQPFS